MFTTKIISWRGLCIVESDWFDSLFTRLKDFSTNGSYLPYIPINKLFKNHNRVDDEIKFLQFRFEREKNLTVKFLDTLNQQIKDFCQNYVRFATTGNANNNNNNNNNNARDRIRLIKALCVIYVEKNKIESLSASQLEKVELHYENIKGLLITLSCKYQRLILENVRLTLNSLSELESLFHENLKLLRFIGEINSIGY